MVRRGDGATKVLIIRPTALKPWTCVYLWGRHAAHAHIHQLFARTAPAPVGFIWHVCVCVCDCMYFMLCVCVCVGVLFVFGVCVWVCVCVCVLVWVCVWVCVYACVCVCVSVHDE